MHLQQVRCDEIRPDPRSGGYRDDEVAPLAESVRVFGVLRPIVLVLTHRGYVIVHGERRWRAARMVGLDSVPATLVELAHVSDAMRVNDAHAASAPMA